MQAISSIDNVGIAVTALEASIEFYRRLGFEKVNGDENSALVQQGRVKLFLFQSNGSNRAAERPLAMDDSEAGIDHISFGVSDIDEVVKSLSDVGIAVESGPISQSWGPRTITVLDPSGVRLWFLDYGA